MATTKTIKVGTKVTYTRRNGDTGTGKVTEINPTAGKGDWYTVKDAETKADGKFRLANLAFA